MTDFLQVTCLGASFGFFMLIALSTELRRHFWITHDVLRWYFVASLLAGFVGGFIGAPDDTMRVVIFAFWSWMVVVSGLTLARREPAPMLSGEDASPPKSPPKA